MLGLILLCLTLGGAAAEAQSDISSGVLVLWFGL